VALRPLACRRDRRVGAVPVASPLPSRRGGDRAGSRLRADAGKERPCDRRARRSTRPAPRRSGPGAATVA